MAIHFSEPELQSRRDNACVKIQQAGLDGLLMFRQESMYYLTGYDTFGYCFFQPRRLLPSAPLGVISPVDGRVVAVDRAVTGVLQGEAHRIRIEIDSFGTYTARSPVEGKIMDLRSVAADQAVDYETNALWVQTDEGDGVVLQFMDYRLGLAPRAIVRFGERVGQGKRCAFLRLTRYAEVHLPISSIVLVEPGQIVVAGSDLIAKLLHS